jgi:hypothetical protein
MSDIEQGLKEAIAEAQAKGREYTHAETDIIRSRPRGQYGARIGGIAGNGEDKRPPLTAPAVIETILELTKQAYAIEALAFELGDALAGGSDQQQGHPVPSNTPEMSVFDRMGIALLDLTRALESIDRNVKRGLGAVKP